MAALQAGYSPVPPGPEPGGLARVALKKVQPMAPQRLPLTVEQVLARVKLHQERRGEWPISTSGQVLGAPGETWSGVNAALALGRRGFPGGSSLSRLLRERLGVKWAHARTSPRGERRAVALSDGAAAFLDDFNRGAYPELELPPREG